MNASHKITRIAIVDDHFAIQLGFKTFLTTLPYIKDVVSFSSAKELFEYLINNPIAAVLLDIRLKKENGLLICKELKVMYPDICVIMMSSYVAAPYIRSAFQNGAQGYLQKDSDIDLIKKALRQILVEQKSYFPDCILVNNDRQSGDLTLREIEIMKLICSGKSNREIAIQLDRQETTIAKHRQNLMEKIGAHKISDVYQYAANQGYI